MPAVLAMPAVPPLPDLHAKSAVPAMPAVPALLCLLRMLPVLLACLSDARCRRQNLADAVRQDEKVDRKIGRNQNQFEALDFNAAVGDSRMTPASAFIATIRGMLAPAGIMCTASHHCLRFSVYTT